MSDDDKQKYIGNELAAEHAKIQADINKKLYDHISKKITVFVGSENNEKNREAILKVAGDAYIDFFNELYSKPSEY